MSHVLFSLDWTGLILHGVDNMTSWQHMDVHLYFLGGRIPSLIFMKTLAKALLWW